MKYRDAYIIENILQISQIFVEHKYYEIGDAIINLKSMWHEAMKNT